MKCAVATVVIGENYQSAYEVIFRPSAQRYADRHGYDLVMFTDYLGGAANRDPRLVTFMKMLVPCHETISGYERLMVVDVDVLFNANAPPFHTLDMGVKIGVVDEWCQPSRESRVSFQRVNGLVPSPREYYALAGFDLDSEVLINSGMFICSPGRHGPFFRDLVARYLEPQRTTLRGLHFEQSMFGYELQTRGLAHLLPVAWNCLWPHHRRAEKWGMSAGTAAERMADLKRFREVLDQSFLLHLTGGLDHDLAYPCRNR